ncbi:MAG: S24 family peptidase [Bacteroidales bacterium]|nr:S24 family peptidase [Bacteroidales bacterium]
MRKISVAYPELNTTWLLTGTGTMLNPTESEAEQLTESDRPNGRVIPVYSMDVVGGFQSPNEIAEDVIAREFFVHAQDGDFAVSVSNDSMSPIIPPGSTVLLRECPVNPDAIDWGKVYVVVYDDGASRVLKRLVHDPHSPDPLAVSLVSYNPDYPPRSLRLTRVCRLYRVVSYHVEC